MEDALFKLANIPFQHFDFGLLPFNELILVNNACPKQKLLQTKVLVHIDLVNTRTTCNHQIGEGDRIAQPEMDYSSSVYHQASEYELKLRLTMPSGVCLGLRVLIKSVQRGT